MGGFIYSLQLSEAVTVTVFILKVGDVGAGRLMNLPRASTGKAETTTGTQVLLLRLDH